MKAKKIKLPKWLSILLKRISNDQKLRVAIVLILIFTIFVNMSTLLVNRSDKYFSTDYWKRYPELKKTYYDSVYANKKGGFPRDEILYAFNGGALISGVSPILVNPEVPPTGKYLVGLSILIFGNEHMVTFIFGLFSLFMMYLVGRQILKSSTAALVAPALITFEPFFKNQFVYTPLFDIFQLAFLLCSFYFFNKAILNKSKTIYWFVLTGIFIGLFISTKFFGSGVTIVAAMVSVLVLNKEFKKMIIFLCILSLSLIILLVSYIKVLIIGYPFLKFLGIQKWILWYNQGHLHNQLSVWLLLFLNKWYLGSGKISSDPQWIVTWPASTLISGLTLFWYLSKGIAREKAIEVLLAWSVFYLLILSFSDTSARYFVILLPVLYIICVWGIKNILIKSNT